MMLHNDDDDGYLADDDHDNDSDDDDCGIGGSKEGRPLYHASDEGESW